MTKSRKHSNYPPIKKTCRNTSTQARLNNKVSFLPKTRRFSTVRTLVLNRIFARHTHKLIPTTIKISPVSLQAKRIFRRTFSLLKSRRPLQELHNSSFSALHFKLPISKNFTKVLFSLIQNTKNSKKQKNKLIQESPSSWE